jgi:hypothetical protein
MKKEIMIEYETIRKSGMTNMLDYSCVINIAKMLRYTELSKLTLEEYKHLLMNYQQYMKEFDI